MFCGAAGKITDPVFMRDDVGDNISNLNKYYSELTGIYCLWKQQLDFDYFGSLHWRRFLVNYQSEQDIENGLSMYDIIVPRPLRFGTSIREQFAQCHSKKNLDIMEKIVNDQLFTQHLDLNEGYFKGLFIAKKEIFNAICEQMFDILFKLEKEINLKEYTGPQERVMGFLAERLFGFYLWRAVKSGKYKVDTADMLYLYGAQ
jgi:hypothetical protein